MAYKPPKRTVAWIVLFTLTGFVDLAQFLIDLTGIGIGVSEATEFAMPAVVIGLLVLFKIPIFSKVNRLASIMGVDLGDALTGGLAPFWILDIWYLWWDVRREDQALIAASQEAEFQDSEMSGPLNEGGFRRPPDTNPEEESPTDIEIEQTSNKRNANTQPINPPPLNMGGMRRPQNRV